MTRFFIAMILLIIVLASQAKREREEARGDAN
jgi:hypothetical protein